MAPESFAPIDTIFLRHSTVAAGGSLAIWHVPLPAFFALVRLVALAIARRPISACAGRGS